MRVWLCVFALPLASCGNKADSSVEQRSTKPVATELGLPTKQPNGAALTAAFCDTKTAQQIYGNLKGCAIVACEGGDNQSCEITRTFATSLGPDDGVTKATGKPVKLEMMDYSKARPIIFDLGWIPTSGPCIGGGVDAKTCRQFPEIGNCMGTGLGFCDMNFTRRDRCLTIITTGGAPDGTEDADPVVRNVGFYRGPCKKDPNEGAL